MQIEVGQLGRQLQGKSSGRNDFGLLCSQMAHAQHGEAVFLDFSGVDSVNSSWLNTAIGPLFRWAAESQNDYYPIFSHFPPNDLDELELVASINRQCYLICETPAESMGSVVVVGSLDPGLRHTLEKVCEAGEATGAELARQATDARIQATAWNNRLRDLFVKRLLLRRKEGRQQVYYPVAKSIVFHDETRTHAANN